MGTGTGPKKKIKNHGGGGKESGDTWEKHTKKGVFSRAAKIKRWEDALLSRENE